MFLCARFISSYWMLYGLHCGGQCTVDGEDNKEDKTREEADMTLSPVFPKSSKGVQKCLRVVQIHISSVFDCYPSFGSLLDHFGHFWRKKTGSGSCHSPLGRVRQPLWDQVQEKYWPNKVTSRASISQEKAN